MISMIRPLAAAVLAVLSGSLSATESNAQPTHEFVLENGLKVIVREDHRAPIVVSQLWYKIGSSFETPGSTGLSHMLEHMMFKGSARLGPGEASRILRDLGAEENAFTGDDFTAYYQVLARDRLAVAFELEADRLASLRLPVDEFAHELDVVKEERRLRVEDKPNALAFERFKALAYLSSGYRNPTIGWMADLNRMTAADARRWYEAWYAPNNATLVVVGDVQLTEVQALAQQYFAPIARRSVPVARPPLELAEPGMRRLTVQVRTQLPSLLMGFNVPSLTTTDNPRRIHALRLLSNLLGGGDSARLPVRLERTQELVTGASVSFDATTRGDSLFLISALPNGQKQHRLEEVEAGIWTELNALKQTPPTLEELERVRAQVIADLVYERDSIAQQASAIGQLESVGLSWHLMDEELSALTAVTPEDVQAAAQDFLTESRLSVAHILPLEESLHEAR